MEQKTEFSDFINKYISGYRLTISNEIEIKRVEETINILKNGVDFEHPDGYSLIKNFFI